MARWFGLSAALLGLCAVTLGAMGAHAWRSLFSDAAFSTFHTTIEFQFYHALALLVVAFSMQRHASLVLQIAGYAFLSGCLLFCGSLYALSVTGIHAFGFITPLGGLAFLSGWGALSWYFLRQC